MPNLVVTFLTLKVHDDADYWPDGAGEIYYWFRVGDTILKEVTRDEPQEASDKGNNTIQIERSTNASVSDDATLVIKGSVSEKDTVTSDEHAGDFEHVHSASNGWGIGQHDVRLNRDDSLDVTITYSIRQA